VRPQWRYVTGHQCLPPGVDVDYVKQNYMSWPTYCGPDYLSYDVYTNPEKFWCGASPMERLLQRTRQIA